MCVWRPILHPHSFHLPYGKRSTWAGGMLWIGSLHCFLQPSPDVRSPKESIIILTHNLLLHLISFSDIRKEWRRKCFDPSKFNHVTDGAKWKSILSVHDLFITQKKLESKYRVASDSFAGFLLGSASKTASLAPTKLKVG